MRDNLPAQSVREETSFEREVALKAARKLRVQRNGQQSVWFGLGMSGLIGWSVAIPTLLGAMLGIWWDRRHPGAHSWTLMLMVLGLTVGCATAWRWIVREDQSIHDEANRTDE
jgi:ATP synthase protein I